MLLPLFPVSPQSPQYNPGSCRGTSTSVAGAEDSSLLHGDSHGAGGAQVTWHKLFRIPEAFPEDLPALARAGLWVSTEHGSNSVNAAGPALQPQDRRFLLGSRHWLCSSSAPALHLCCPSLGMSHSSSGKRLLTLPNTGWDRSPCSCQSFKGRQEQEKHGVFQSHSCVPGSSKTF